MVSVENWESCLDSKELNEVFDNKQMNSLNIINNNQIGSNHALIVANFKNYSYVRISNE